MRSISAIPLDVARLCLDCDLLVAIAICPLCGSDRAVPVFRWLTPLQAGGDGARSAGVTSIPGGPGGRGAPPPEQGPPPRVLVVEDQESVRELLCDLVATLGYTPEGAASGEEALVRLDAGQCALVLTDLAMGSVSGWDLIGEIRGRGLEMPVIMITGHVTPEDEQRARLGAVPILRKPFRIADVSRLIREMLGAPAR